MITKLTPWILATRPKTLSTCVVPILVPTILAQALGYRIQWWISILAFLAAICIQIATNLINDALDFKKGADTEKRIGPTRVTQSGLISERQVFGGGIFFFALAFCLGIPLIVYGGWIIGILLLISILCGYLYTGGPYPLSYVGLGDFFVLLFYGFVIPCTVYYLQTNTIDHYVLLSSLQSGLLCTSLIAVNNLRDIEEDSTTGKKTMAVRFGKTFGRIEISFTTLFPFVLNLVWIYFGFPLAAFLPFLVAPLAYKVVSAIWRHEPSPVYNQLLGMVSLVNLLFGLLFSLGLHLQ